MEITISWIFNIIVTLAMSVIGWSLKEQYKQIKNDKQETREYVKENITKLDARVVKLEDKLPKEYVLKEDFYREINKLDLKLDSVKDDIAELNKNVTALLTTIQGGVGK